MHLFVGGYKSASQTHALSIRSTVPQEHRFCHTPDKLLAGIRHTPSRIWSVLALAPLAGLHHHYVRVLIFGDRLSPIEMPHIQSINCDDGFMTLVH
jgi:hypothetical protein